MGETWVDLALEGARLVVRRLPDARVHHKDHVVRRHRQAHLVRVRVRVRVRGRVKPYSYSYPYPYPYYHSNHPYPYP